MLRRGLAKISISVCFKTRSPVFLLLVYSVEALNLHCGYIPVIISIRFGLKPVSVVCSKAVLLMGKETNQLSTLRLRSSGFSVMGTTAYFAQPT